MATQYTLAITEPESGKFECIYCGDSEEDAIKAGLKSKCGEVHIVTRPPVSRVIDNVRIAAKKAEEAKIAKEAEKAKKAEEAKPKK